MDLEEQKVVEKWHPAYSNSFYDTPEGEYVPVFRSTQEAGIEINKESAGFWGRIKEALFGSKKEVTSSFPEITKPKPATRATGNMNLEQLCQRYQFFSQAQLYRILTLEQALRGRSFEEDGKHPFNAELRAFDRLDSYLESGKNLEDFMRENTHLLQLFASDNFLRLAEQESKQ